jgi:hypothetical protein
LIAARSVGDSVVLLITDFSMKHGKCGNGWVFRMLLKGKGRFVKQRCDRGEQDYQTGLVLKASRSVIVFLWT